MTPAAQDRLGVRPLVGGAAELDPTVIAASIRSSGRYDYRFVVRPSALAVAIEVLERDGRPSMWCSRCLVCGLSDEHIERMPFTCCGSLRRATRVPAGWRWSADVDWTMERARAEGALEDDPKELWKRYPLACLFGRAIREAWKLHAPDALPLGIVEAFPPDEDRARDERRRAPARPAAPAPRVSVVEAKRRREESERAPKKLTKSQEQATTALARALAGNPPVTIDGQEAERERARLEAEGIARLESEVAADTRPAAADPDWFTDTKGPAQDAAIPPARVPAPVNAEGSLPSAAFNESEVQNDSRSAAGPAVGPAEPHTPRAVEQGGGESDAPRADGPHPSALAPAEGAVPVDACWDCNTKPCACAPAGA